MNTASTPPVSRFYSMEVGLSLKWPTRHSEHKEGMRRPMIPTTPTAGCRLSTPSMHTVIDYHQTAARLPIYLAAECSDLSIIISFAVWSRFQACVPQHGAPTPACLQLADNFIILRNYLVPSKVGTITA